MAHIFDGRWSSTLIPETAPRRDLPFQLEVDPATGNLKPNSTHGSEIVTGQATSSHIEMTHTLPQLPGVTLKYEGDLCGEIVVGGRIRLMARGVFTLITPGSDNRNLEPIEGFEAIFQILREKRESQTQEIWVATKP